MFNSSVIKYNIYTIDTQHYKRIEIPVGKDRRYSTKTTKKLFASL